MISLGKIHLLFFGFCFLVGFSQEKQYSFKAFGVTPEVVPTALYKKLQNASNINERITYLDEIAQVFLTSGNADSLIHYSQRLKRALVLTRPQDTTSNIYKFKALFYQGIGAQKIGFMDKAISSFIEGIEATNTHTYFNTAFKLELAQTYLLKGSPEKVKPIIDELEISKKHPELYLRYLVLLSGYQIFINDFNSAQTTISNGLSENFIEEYFKAKLQLQLQLAEIKFKQNDFKQSIAMSTAIKDQALQQGFFDVYIAAVLNEGRCYVLLKDYQIAEIALNTAYVNALQWHRLELKQKIIKALVQLYNTKGDYKNAFNLMTQYQAVNNTIAENQNQLLVSDLELKYETLKKEKEIDKLREDQLVKQAEIERQKTIKFAFLIGFLIILIPVILLLVVYYQKLQAQSLLNTQKEAINKQEVKALMQSQELTLVKNTISVQRKERDRIARELHDSIGGNLAAIKLKMNNLGDSHPDFKKILQQLDATYDQVREISHSLIPKEFENSSFTELIDNYIQNFSQDPSVNLRFNAYPDEAINNLETHFRLALFNILKELITNAFKHAQASEIEIQLTLISEDNSIELIYEDDGVGFNVNKTNKGMGLSNLEKRVKALQGSFSINSAINRGTVITISIPQ